MERKKLGIVNYECGNIQSLVNAVQFLGANCILVNSSEELFNCSKIILPGVGSFDYAMLSLKEKGMHDSIQLWTQKKSNTLLGICLGMQLLCNSSEESANAQKGLGLINAEVRSLRKMVDKKVKIPHMGWNSVYKTEACKVNFLIDESDFYFVHGYGCFVLDPELSLGRTNYSDISFDSVISNGGNIFGVQFHPEKSYQTGLRFLNEFIKYA